MNAKIEKLENKINRCTKNKTTRYQKNIHKMLSGIDKKHKQMLSKENLNEKIIHSYSRSLLNFTNFYAKLLEPFKDFARKTTVPINYPLFLYLKERNRLSNNILFANGVHFFVALQGGGKSTLAYELIERIRINTGKSAYINADFELPKQDDITKKYYMWHNRFELLDFFDMSIQENNPDIKVSQRKRFNRHFDTIVLDEWLTEMNHRLNRTKQYNNIFLALLTMIAHMRHQKMKRIYVLSQIDNTDTQLLSMFKYIHEVQIDLDIEYSDWVKSGMLSKNIKGWNVWTYGVKRNRKSQSNDKVLIKKQYLHKTADFNHFDTLSQASKYDNLDEDRVKFL